MAHFSEFTPALKVVIQKPAPACNPGMSLILNHAEAGRWPREVPTVALYRNVAPLCCMALTIVGIGTVLYSVACSPLLPDWPAYPPRCSGSNRFGTQLGSPGRISRPTLRPITHA
jgi:hypothetical protein